ncbi:MAG: hypothetical protein FJZ64_02580 [Chlamydiae bacterium]|nr:hypothetical protein [Chlamydiota bacterium]
MEDTSHLVQIKEILKTSHSWSRSLLPAFSSGVTELCILAVSFDRIDHQQRSCFLPTSDYLSLSEDARKLNPN